MIEYEDAMPPEDREVIEMVEAPIQTLMDRFPGLFERYQLNWALERFLDDDDCFEKLLKNWRKNDLSFWNFPTPAIVSTFLQDVLGDPQKDYNIYQVSKYAGGFSLYGKIFFLYERPESVSYRDKYRLSTYLIRYSDGNFADFTGDEPLNLIERSIQKMSSSLTPEQEAMVPEWVDKWLKIGTSCEPCDVPKAVESAKQVYRDTGAEPPPTHIVFKSPRSAAIGAAIMKKLEDNGELDWDEIHSKFPSEVTYD